MNQVKEIIFRLEQAILLLEEIKNEPDASRKNRVISGVAQRTISQAIKLTELCHEE